jgi:hypothetical protein
VVFAPRGTPHTFRIKSPQSRAITVCTPACFEDWFREMGEPATSFDLPDEVQAIPDADRPRMMALSRRLNTEIVGEVEF